MSEVIKYNKKKLAIYSTLSLVFAALSFITYSKHTDNEKQSISVNFDKVENTTYKSDKIAKNLVVQSEKKSKTKLIEKNLSLSPEIISYRQVIGKYLIIVGTFREKDNALGLCNQMLDMGHINCKIVYNGTSLYWVSLNTYDNKNGAFKEIKKIKVDGWIKKI